ncbi:MAG: hypothetical protein MZV65_16015 [Chromatiales bacterium]|nr:hypothetical protein [Chromatiales bacterium]
MMRRDFDSLAYSDATYADRPGRETRDPGGAHEAKTPPGGRRMSRAQARPYVPPEERAVAGPGFRQVPGDVAGAEPPGHHGEHVPAPGDRGRHRWWTARPTWATSTAASRSSWSGRLWMQNFPLVCRIAVPEPDFNEYCYAAALEELAGIEVPDKAVWLRTLSLEMIRLASFLMWIGGQAGAFGHGTIAQWSVTMRDYVLDLFEELSGGRIYHMYIIPGGVRADVPPGFLRHVLETMDRRREEPEGHRARDVPQRGDARCAPRVWGTSPGLGGPLRHHGPQRPGRGLHAATSGRTGATWPIPASTSSPWSARSPTPSSAPGSGWRRCSRRST